MSRSNDLIFSCLTKHFYPLKDNLAILDLLAAQKTHLTYYYNMTLEGKQIIWHCPLLNDEILGSSEKNARRMNRILQYNPIIVHPKESDLMDEIKRGNVFYSTYDIEFLPYPVSSWNKEQV